MSNVCCKEFKGWCKAFTRTERLLTILEAALLTVLVALLVFVIVHLIVCGEPTTPEKPGPGIPDHHSSTTDSTQDTPKTTTADQTFPPDKKCSWTPSSKTTAATRYFRSTTTITQPTRILDHIYNNTFDDKYNNTFNFDDLITYSEQSDGEESPESEKCFILALVKIGVSETMFGCILTAVNLYWAVTSASCVQAIEVGDSLDAWWMVEGYGAGAAGRRHAVADVQEHPRWRGADAGCDLAALRSDDRLVGDVAHAVRLPTMVDYYLMTIGENFTVLGFGRFRTVEESRSARQLRRARVWSLPPALCPAPDAPAPAPAAAPLWSARHLGRGRAVLTAPCHITAGPLCFGVRYTRGKPCNYCAGTPLLGGGAGGVGGGEVLYGVMSDNRQCGEACEPQLYVNVATVRDWLDAVIAE